MHIDLIGTELYKASQSDWREVADITAEGFAEDPINLWAFENARAVRSVMTIMTRDIYLKQGFGHLHGNEGATLWLPPGVSANFGGLAMLKFALGLARYASKGALTRGQALGEKMQQHHPSEPHYYLFTIATRDAARGQGIGKGLLDPMLAHADRERMPVYLENSNPANSGFYVSRGFERATIFEVEDGGPVMEPMWREPS